MSIFVFHSEQARRAISSGVKVFSKREYSDEAIRELKAWNKKGGFSSLTRLRFVV